VLLVPVSQLKPKLCSAAAVTRPLVRQPCTPHRDPPTHTSSHIVTHCHALSARGHLSLSGGKAVTGAVPTHQETGGQPQQQTAMTRQRWQLAHEIKLKHVSLPIIPSPQASTPQLEPSFAAPPASLPWSCRSHHSSSPVSTRSAPVTRADHTVTLVI
jgi:hypothetical protein